MTDRDDREWLLARERGEDVSHIPEDTRARYRELGQLIASLPGRSPSPGWKQRTLAAIDQPAPPPVAELEPPEPSQLEKRVSSQPAPPPVAELEPPEPSQLEKLVSSQPAPLTPEQPERPAPPRVRRRPRWQAAGAAVAAVAAAVVLFVALRPRPVGEPIARAEIHRSQQPHRGDDVSIGDTLVVRCDADRPVEIRVYGDAGEPLVRCRDDGGCQVTRDGEQRHYTLELVLRTHGDVRAVLFPATAGLPPPHDLNGDFEAAHRAGIEAKHVAMYRVQ